MAGRYEQQLLRRVVNRRNVWCVLFIGYTAVVGCSRAQSPGQTRSSSVAPAASAGPTGAENLSSETPQQQLSDQRLSGDYLSPNELYLAAALAPSVNQVAAYDASVDSYRSDCLAAAGFDETAKLAPLYPDPAVYSAATKFLYFDDLSLIQQYGYFWPDRGGLIPSSGGAYEPDTSISDEFSAALEDCNQPLRELQTNAYERHDLTGVVVDIFDAQIFDVVTGRNDVQKTYALWKVCMATGGFPRAVLREPTDQIETIDQALLDYQCRIDTGYTSTVVNAQADEVEQWLASNPGLTAAFSALWSDLLDASTKL